MLALRLGAPVLLAVVLAPAGAAAKSISISIFPSAEVKDGALTLQLRVSNSGDEAAESVVPALQFGDKTVRAEPHPSLGPNDSMNTTLSLDVGNLGPGRWPYRVTVDYTDANQYPFQALHMGLVTLGNPPTAKVAVSEVKAAPLSGSGSLRMAIKNLAGVDRKAKVVVALPEGLEVTKAVEPVSLGAWKDATVSVPIVNRTALPGSRYPVFAAVEFEDDGVHQAVVAQALVEIESPQSFFRIPRTTFLIIAAVLVAAWLGFLLRQVTARRAA